MIAVAFHAHTDIVVVGTNSENADYDNPRGEIFGFSGGVIATDEHGNRRRLYVTTSQIDREAMEAAQRVADALTARLALGKQPVAFDSWTDTFPAYGSPAYSNEEAVEWERSLEQ